MMTFYVTIDSDEIREYMPDMPILLPASSFARDGTLRVPYLPAHLSHLAADCGGFVATFIWGDYRYSAEEYVTWLSSLKQAPAGMTRKEAREAKQWRAIYPRWAATMDYCCEDEITSGQPGIVRSRQEKTTEMAYHFWQTYREVSWVWVPTIQGWTVEDYERHAQQMLPLIREMAAHYGPEREFRVGIGTLCHRASSEMIRSVALAVSRVLGDVPLHLWGIKLSALQSQVALPPQVASIDSAAWHGTFGRDIRAYHGSGMTKRQWSYEVALPRYMEKIRTAQAGAKQFRLL